MRLRSITTAILLATASCVGDPSGDGRAENSGNSPPDAVPAESVSGAAADSVATDLVDPTIAPAIAGEEGWGYSQTAEADLSGDGEPERVVLTARVEMVRGRPAWDDGQPWQVYIEMPDGDRTYLYARRLQLGTLTMRVAQPDGDSPASVILVEHLPDRLAVYESLYTAAGSATTYVRFVRTLDPRGETAGPQFP